MPDDLPSRDAEALRSFLAERDAACPSCGYNLWGLQSDQCPECGREMKLELSLAQDDVRWVVWPLRVSIAAMLLFLALWAYWVLDFYFRVRFTMGRGTRALWEDFLGLTSIIVCGACLVWLCTPCVQSWRARTTPALARARRRLVRTVLACVTLYSAMQAVHYLYFWIRY